MSPFREVMTKLEQETDPARQAKLVVDFYKEHYETDALLAAAPIRALSFGCVKGDAIERMKKLALLVLSEKGEPYAVHMQTLAFTNAKYLLDAHDHALDLCVKELGYEPTDFDEQKRKSLVRRAAREAERLVPGTGLSPDRFVPGDS